MRARTFLVTGATGRQGGALARQLLGRGHRVRVFTRSPGNSPARQLERLGAHIYPGNLDDAVPLERAMAGCDGAFAVATFREEGVLGEVRHGRALVDAARRTQLPHLVYSSMAGASRMTGVPHIDSKGEVEGHLAHAGVPYTILAPVFFMENWLSVVPAALAVGTLRYPLPRDRKLQMVAVEDVARFARVVLERPTEFESRRIEVAGDELTMEEVAKVLGGAAGRELSYTPVSLQVVRARSEQLGRLCAWLAWEGTQVDVDRLRRRYQEVGFHRLENWALRQDWERLLSEAMGAEAGRAIASGAR